MIPSPDTAARHSLLAREQRAPRYTSYPTAMEFSGDFSEQDYRQAVQRTNEEPTPAPLSLYLHIPFCSSACFYCGCHKVISRNADSHEHYLRCLLKEIELQGALFAPDRPVRQIHFGGGTPNLLRPRQLARILNAIVQQFQLAEDCEISLEVDPREYRPRDAQAWALMGFNRISIGVQDTDPQVQRLINRRQSSAGISSLVRESRVAGIGSVNFDLIYGLPGQTPETFEQTLNFVEALRPERLAIFHYAHMPARFPAQRAIDEHDLPSLASSFDIHKQSRDRLLAAGYTHIGMDHYALPQDPLARAQTDGTLRRNFQGYTVLGDCDLIGFGLSAISQVGNCLAQNLTQLDSYERCLEQNRLAITRGLTCSDDDRVRSHIIEQIMCDGGIDARDLEDNWQVSLETDFGRELDKLGRLDPQGRWCRLVNRRLIITPEGQDFLRLIAQCFDAYADRRGDRSAKPLHDMRRRTPG